MWIFAQLIKFSLAESIIFYTFTAKLKIIKLGIADVTANYSSWRSADKEMLAQIDLVIDRNDRVINLCEMKYSNDEYVITKEYNDNLRRKRACFIEETKIRKTVHTTMVTTYGVKHNSYWGNIQSEVKMDNLFVF